MRIILIFIFLSSSIRGVLAANDIPVNPNLTWNGEISLAVNPLNPANCVVAWMKLTTFTTASIAISYSTNSGNTWSEPVYLPHFSSGFTSADPTLICSGNGVFYFAYIDYNNISLSAGSVYVTRSTDGGDTWTTPVQAIDVSAAPDKPIDRPWLAMDNSNGVNHGMIYLVTKSYKDAVAPHHIYLVKSGDGGTTWSSAKVLDDFLPVGATSNTMGVPCVTINGALVVNYLSYDPSLSLHVRDVIIQSNDGGQTFTGSIISEIPDNSIIPPGDSLFQYSYAISANPADSNNLVHVFTDRRNGDWDIWGNYSLDAGITWSTTTRLNDDPVGNGIGQDMCWGGFSTNGIYAVLWRDRRDGTSGQFSPYRIYGAYSLDHGATFSANLALSQTLAPLSIPVTGNDFLGACMGDSTIYGVWADKRNGLNQEYFNSYKILPVSGIFSSVSHQTVQIIPAIITSATAVINPRLTSGMNNFQVTVFDLIGHRILYQVNSPFLDLSGIPAGMYIIEFNTGATFYHQRFILE